ncbi:MAG: hypothetical protein ACMUIS_06790 [bacterium]
MHSLRVECYEGYKTHERPRYIVVDGKRRMVERVIDQWRTPEFEFFNTLAEDGRMYLLRYDREHDIWELKGIGTGTF